jgi:hypothetical protein
MTVKTPTRRCNGCVVLCRSAGSPTKTIEKRVSRHVSTCERS